jgi:hydroxyacylglutathione hydrolase
MVILDVRGQDEWEAGHIKKSTHIYVGNLENNLDKLPNKCQVVVYCGSARRSNIAASILKRSG